MPTARTPVAKMLVATRTRKTAVVAVMAANAVTVAKAELAIAKIANVAIAARKTPAVARTVAVVATLARTETVVAKTANVAIPVARNRG